MVYRDGTIEKVVGSLISELIVTVESAQYHVCAEVLDTFGLILPRLHPELRNYAADSLRRVVPSVSRHVLTLDMRRALDRLQQTLSELGHTEEASFVENVTSRLAGVNEHTVNTTNGQA